MNITDFTAQYSCTKSYNVMSSVSSGQINNLKPGGVHAAEFYLFQWNSIRVALSSDHCRQGVMMNLLKKTDVDLFCPTTAIKLKKQHVSSTINYLKIVQIVWKHTEYNKIK